MWRGRVLVDKEERVVYNGNIARKRRKQVSVLDLTLSKFKV